MEATPKMNICIVIPCYNDWEALALLAKNLGKTGLHRTFKIELLIVDDCSNVEFQDYERLKSIKSIEHISILRLKKNLGHQRAITSGLCYLAQNNKIDLVVVMDSDGEDNPDNIIDLLHESNKKNHKEVVFARRSKRSERMSFRFFYSLYTFVFRMLTGDAMRVGNFSLIPRALLPNIGVISELWNHYSAGLRRSGIPFSEINVPRAKRLCGKSKMNLVTLVTHGLSSIAVYGEVVATRILIFSATLASLSFLGLVAIILIRLFTNWTSPGSGYATYMSLFMVFGLFQSVFMGMIFSMMVLSARNSATQTPIDNFQRYLDKIISVF